MTSLRKEAQVRQRLYSSSRNAKSGAARYSPSEIVLLSSVFLTRSQAQHASKKTEKESNLYDIYSGASQDRAVATGNAMRRSSP